MTLHHEVAQSGVVHHVAGALRLTWCGKSTIKMIPTSNRITCKSRSCADFAQTCQDCLADKTHPQYPAGRLTVEEFKASINPLDPDGTAIFSSTAEEVQAASLAALNTPQDEDPFADFLPWLEGTPGYAYDEALRVESADFAADVYVNDTWDHERATVASIEGRVGSILFGFELTAGDTRALIDALTRALVARIPDSR